MSKTQLCYYCALPFPAKGDEIVCDRCYVEKGDRACSVCHVEGQEQDSFLYRLLSTKDKEDETT